MSCVTVCCLHVCREELQEKIAELEVEVAGIAVNNPRVVEEYLKRKAEIEKLAQDLAAQRAELDSLHTEIEQLKVCGCAACASGGWLRWIDECGGKRVWSVDL
jgi:chromosome segregation ATPase